VQKQGRDVTALFLRDNLRRTPTGRDGSSMHENLGEKGDLPISAFPSQAAWAEWLEVHHADAQGVWLALPKKGGGETGLTYAEALEVALCYGWIDGQKARLDERFWLQRFTPRRPGSVWSRVNRDKALELIAREAMRPAGLREVERAQADGRWDAAYESASTMTVPDDLQEALAANPSAEAFFATLDRANRFAVLYRVQSAKKPETRTRRIETLVAMLADGKKIH
jgi:uncharacterized protein YdeI (YjbR/CyaY-like superfamily)